MNFHKMVLTLAVMTLSASAFAAEPNCTTEPKDQWMSEDAMKKKLTDEGYKIAKFKTTAGHCYEIYGTDSAGKKVEIYFNPVTGAVVK